MPRISPNRIRTRSPEKAWERETIATPRASMATNSRPMAVSEDRFERRVMKPMPKIIPRAPGGRPEHARQAQEHGDGHPGQHAVGQGVADEGEAPQHHEGADDAAGDGHQDPGQERVEP